MGKGACDLAPKVKVGNKEEDSKSFLELVKLTGSDDRALAGYLYASSKIYDSLLEQEGFTRNAQGEFSGKDIASYFELTATQNNTTDVKISTLLRREGITDDYGMRRTLEAEEALNKALNIQNYTINQNGKTIHPFSAYITRSGTGYTVVVSRKDANSIKLSMETKNKLSAWEILKDSFNQANLDLNTLSAVDNEFFNAYNSLEIPRWLHNIQTLRNNLIREKDIKRLLALNEHTTQYHRIIQKYGDIDAAAKRIVDIYTLPTNVSNVTPAEFSLIDASVSNFKSLSQLNIDGNNGIIDQINNLDNPNSTNFSTENEVLKCIQDIERECNISKKIRYVNIKKSIDSFSEIADRALFDLDRELREVREAIEKNPREKRLLQIQKTLQEGAERDRTYVGALLYLNEMNSQIEEVLTSLLDLNSLSDVQSKDSIAEISKAVIKSNNLQKRLNLILKGVANIDKIFIDEFLTQDQMNDLKNLANRMLEGLEKHERIVETLAQRNFTSIGETILGQDKYKDLATSEVITQCINDHTFMDYLYEMGNVKNPLIASMDDIIRTAQNARDLKMQDISLKIRRSSNLLKKAGYKNTRFMYEVDENGDPTGRIISDIDWESYNKERYKFRNDLKERGYKDLNLREAMEAWEEAHTEERVVDFKNGRTERVPDNRYRKQMPTLTDAQQKYYDAMMQLKGELGSLLPQYAQKQYLAPQIRMSFLEALGEARKRGSFEYFLRAIKNNIKDIYTIWEDDTSFARNGDILGADSSYYKAKSDYEGQEYRTIPIFYIRNLKDPRDLYINFSSGMAHLAKTSLNYEALNNVRSTLEFMREYMASQEATKSIGTKKALDLITLNNTWLAQKVYSLSKKYGTATLTASFLDKKLYGIQNNSEATKTWRIFTKIAKKLLWYTSLKNLAVNVKGAIANYGIGEIQMLIESGAGEFYNINDYAWAHVKILGDRLQSGGAAAVDLLINSYDPSAIKSKASLLGTRFEVLDEGFDDLGSARYYNGALMKLVNKNCSFLMYSLGEQLIHYVNLYSVLHNIKVNLNGKEVPLYNIFYTEVKDGNAELKYKDATYVDENGNTQQVDEAFLDKIKNRVAYVNHSTHGAMSENSKGLIHQYIAGKFLMCLKQWMVGHYSRRFRGEHFEQLLNETREGYYTTVAKVYAGYIRAITGLNLFEEFAKNRKDLKDWEKANIRRARTETFILGLLYALQSLLGDPKEHKGEWFYRMMQYQIFRAITEVGGSHPIKIVEEGPNLIQNPVPSTNIWAGLMYPIYGIGDLGETYQGGRFAGKDKYWSNMYRYWIPFLYDIEKTVNFAYDDNVFKKKANRK